MPVPVSSLSVAVQGVADFLDEQFGEEVNITVAHPQRASEIAKSAGATAHCLNIFAYRMAPSGFHADAGADETQFIRVNALLTPFPADLDNAADDADLRILGHAIRVLQSHPVLPITGAPLPGGAITEPAGRKDYRLQSVMLAPPMEEMNHIWTTQGGDLAYRLSAVYEFSLVPIEPLEPRIEASPPQTLVIDAAASVDGAALDFISISNDSRAIPLGDGETAPPTNWLPVQMLVSGDLLTNTLAIPPTATEVTVAISGPNGEAAALEVIWTLGDESESAQPAQIVPIASAVLDADEAEAVLSLAIPATAVSAVVHARPAAAGVPVPDSPVANVLTLSVT